MYFDFLRYCQSIAYDLKPRWQKFVAARLFECVNWFSMYGWSDWNVSYCRSSERLAIDNWKSTAWFWF